MSDEIVVGQIGCGYWGPNILRNLTARHECRVKAVAEASEERRQFIKEHYPEIHVTEDAQDLLKDTEIQALAIATPASSHFHLAKAALEADKHVLVEKPMALNVEDADELVDLARDKDRILMVGYTYLYNKALHALKKNIDSGSIGEPFYFDLKRLNLGIARQDVNAWWNLAPHDVSILLYLREGKMPSSVSATGVGYIQKGNEDAVYARLVWEDGVEAYIHVSWLNPEKVRRLTLVGRKKMAVLDELADHALSLYNKGIDLMPAETQRRDYDNFEGVQLVHRVGDVDFPDIEESEPLAEEIRDFILCVSNNTQPVSGAEQGRKVTAVMAAVQESLKNNGRPVILG